MKHLNDIISQIETVGISKEKQKEPILKKLEGIIEERENIFYFVKSHFNGKNGVVFLTSMGILFVAENGARRLYTDRIPGERITNIRFDVAMFNNSTLIVDSQQKEFKFESINKQDGEIFMEKYKRYHGVIFSNKRTQSNNKSIGNKNEACRQSWVIGVCSVIVIAMFIALLLQFDYQKNKKHSSSGPREVMLKEGNGSNLKSNSNKVVVGESDPFDKLDKGQNFDSFASAATSNQVGEILKAIKPEEKKQEVDKLNDLLSRLGKMVVETFEYVFVREDRVFLLIKKEDGSTEEVEVNIKDSEKETFKSFILEKSLYKKDLNGELKCEGKAELNPLNKLVLNECSVEK